MANEQTPRSGPWFPIEKEPKILTLEKPLIIESACPGWQPGGARFPAVPRTIKEQVKEISDSVKAGAIAVHIHPRNPETGRMEMSPKLLREVMDGVFDTVGDCVALNHSWWPVAGGDIDYISHASELLEMGQGNKYVQASSILPIGHYAASRGSYFSDETTIKGIKFLEANKIKPIYMLYDSAAHWRFKQSVIDEGASTWKPYLMNLNFGKHDAHAIEQDPWSYLQLITNFNMVKATIPESLVGVYPGGRNWLPILNLGIIMGATIVRVGIEDCYWMYPHKDEVIKKNADTVKVTVEMAQLLGRRVVTDADEARKILGLVLTSKL